jgi:hypothetical protein
LGADERSGQRGGEERSPYLSGWTLMNEAINEAINEESISQGRAWPPSPLWLKAVS